MECEGAQVVEVRQGFEVTEWEDILVCEEISVGLGGTFIIVDFDRPEQVEVQVLARAVKMAPEVGTKVEDGTAKASDVRAS